MPRLKTLVTRPDASNHLSHVTWVFRITLRSSVETCRNVSFASAIPSLLPEAFVALSSACVSWINH